jgi:hypothetical protein
MLVSFFRNPIFARVVGIVVALAFLLPLIRYKHGIKIAVPLVIFIVIALVIRNYLIKRKRRLTALEEEYLKKRFYQH